MKRNSGLQKRWLRNTLSILFAIAVPSLLGYIHLSQFRKNESYAKTM